MMKIRLQLNLMWQIVATSGAETSANPTITVKTNRRSIFDSEIDY